jgi:hydroxypyruvate isomerase
MPRFAANLTFLFRELPFLDRFEAAAEAGFTGVEVLFPYDDAAKEITRRLRAHDLKMVLINAPPPNWTGGARGFAAVPGLAERFRQDFRRALRFAEALGAEHLHLMAGEAQGAAAHRTYVDNLKWAADQAPEASLTIEPLNPRDMPGYFLSSYDQAVEVLDEVAAPNLHLQFDMYHAQTITGDGMACWEAHGSRARHVQVGGVPGRHEPLKGAVDYPAFFATLDAAGYRGWVSAEYNPRGQTEAGLDWLRAAAEGS